MKKQKFEILINAPVEKVYKTMLGLDAKETYSEWTKPFNPVSTYQGTWDKGSKIYFIGEDNGKTGGMISTVVENIPNKYVAVTHIGVLDGDEEVLEGDGMEEWLGGIESYTFEETDGGTKVIAESDVIEKYEEFFNEVWPQALARLKEICEEK